MRNIIRKTMLALRKDERGVTLVEYGIAIALAVTVGTGALLGLAGQINTTLGSAQTAME